METRPSGHRLACVRLLLFGILEALTPGLFDQRRGVKLERLRALGHTLSPFFLFLFGLAWPYQCYLAKHSPESLPPPVLEDRTLLALIHPLYLGSFNVERVCTAMRIDSLLVLRTAHPFLFSHGILTNPSSASYLLATPARPHSGAR